MNSLLVLLVRGGKEWPMSPCWWWHFSWSSLSRHDLTELNQSVRTAVPPRGPHTSISQACYIDYILTQSTSLSLESHSLWFLKMLKLKTTTNKPYSSPHIPFNILLFPSKIPLAFCLLIPFPELSVDASALSALASSFTPLLLGSASASGLSYARRSRGVDLKSTVSSNYVEIKSKNKQEAPP